MRFVVLVWVYIVGKKGQNKKNVHENHYKGLSFKSFYEKIGILPNFSLL